MSDRCRQVKTELMAAYHDDEWGRPVHDEARLLEKVALEGFPYDKELCPRCARRTYYYDDYDAIFCPDCNAWLESTCTDPACSYCPNRPARPLPVSP